MTTIDHRILIPAGPEAVWEYVSDITHNPDWQIDCTEVIFLTSRREGPGVRWRYSAPNGHEYVIAVTAWYNGLGYEYYFVDGVPFKENKGRIRLQEIPEGTIVQWTYTYELGGLFGGMRNAMGVSRGVDFTISESLKTLHQKIKQTGASSRPHEAKSLMRDAPNVDARSAYQPRHPSVMDEDEAPPPQKPRPAAVPRPTAEPPLREGDGQRIRVIAEPPIAEDDTRRRKAAAAPPPLLEDSIPPDIEGEPDFLRQLVDLSRFEPPRSPSDTQPRKPVTPAEEAAPPSPPAPVSPFEDFAPPQRQPSAPTPEPSPFQPPSRIAEPLPSAEDTAPVSAASKPAEEPTAPAPDVRDETQADYVSPARIYDWPVKPEPETPSVKAEPVSEAAPPPPRIEPPPAPPKVEAAPESQAAPKPAPMIVEPPRSPSDTASIWEIFGIPRPSETAAAPVQPVPAPAETPADAVPAPAPTPTETPADVAPAPVPDSPAAPVAAASLPEKFSLPPASTHVGLRVALRRRLVTVRRP